MRRGDVPEQVCVQGPARSLTLRACAPRIMAERALANPKIQPMWNSEVVEVKGDSKSMTSVAVRNVVSGKVEEVPARWPVPCHRPHARRRASSAASSHLMRRAM